MHRALQVIGQVADLLIATGAWGSRVYVRRVYSLLEEEAEMPAVVIFPREDTPTSDLGASNMAFIDSLQGLSVTVLRKGSDEQALLTELYEDRRQIHLALMADITLGLSFVADVRYQGATQPLIDGSGERLVGLFETRWAVLYRMNFADPQ